MTVDAACATGTHTDLEMRLRGEARRLVDKRMTDRKKEMVALLSTGMSQLAAAKKLGLSRQAVSKALQSIPADYRFDLGYTASNAIT